MSGARQKRFEIRDLPRDLEEAVQLMEKSAARPGDPGRPHLRQVHRQQAPGDRGLPPERRGRVRQAGQRLRGGAVPAVPVTGLPI